MTQNMETVDTVIEFDKRTIDTSGDRFQYTRGKHIREFVGDSRKRKVSTRWWELLCYRGGRKSYHVRVTRGQVHFKIIRKYARIDPVKQFLNSVLRINNSRVADVLIYERCRNDKCVYTMNKYMIYCEYGNPEGMLVWRDSETGRRRRKLIKIDTSYVPLLAEMATRQQLTMRAHHEIKPPTHVGEECRTCPDCAGKVKTTTYKNTPLQQHPIPPRTVMPRPVITPIPQQPTPMAVRTNLTAGVGASSPALDPVQLQRLKSRVDVLRDQLARKDITESDLISKLRDLSRDVIASTTVKK